jgi:hypothetical protein
MDLLKKRFYMLISFTKAGILIESISYSYD